jgi:hypothetical protein
MKLVPEHINEKFTEDNSDPIADMGIGDVVIKRWESILDNWRSQELRTYKNIFDKYFSKYCNKSESRYKSEIVRITYFIIMKLIEKSSITCQETFDIISKQETIKIDETYPVFKIRRAVARALKGIFRVEVDPRMNNDINEKFSEDSDPIKDMGIGIYAHRKFNSLDELYDWMYENIPYILNINNIDEIIYRGPGSYYIVPEYYDALMKYLEKYVLLKSGNGKYYEVLSIHPEDFRKYVLNKKRNIKESLNENNKENVTILLPGSYKPMHAAHVELIKHYSTHSNVKEIKVLIGSGVRNGITQKEAIQIAKILLSSFPKVSIEASIYPSPILTAYKYIETAEPGIYALGGSKKEDDYSRVLKFVKDHSETGTYYNLKPKDVKVIELLVDTTPILYKDRTDEYNGQPISASILRQDILNDDFYNFETNYPEYGEYETREIWKIIKSVVRESLNNNLIPEEIIDTFYNRIKKLIDTHKDKKHPFVKKELDRIKDLNGKIPDKIKNLLIEKFIEDSDPIRDMGIGVVYKPRTFANYKEAADFLLMILPNILNTDKIPDDILIMNPKSQRYVYNEEYKTYITSYILKYINNGNMGFAIDTYRELKNKLEKLKYKPNSLQEKFTEDSDPIHDMGIGIKRQLDKFVKHQIEEVGGWGTRYNENDLETALRICVFCEKEDFVNYLISIGVNISFDNQKPLRNTAWPKNKKMAKKLIYAGADIDAAIRRESISSHREFLEEVKREIENEKKLKESFNNKLLYEGGNVFENTSPIKKEHITPTLNKFKERLQQIFPNIKFDFSILGSAGKKDISNDIDLALSDNTIFNINGEVKYEDWNISEEEFNNAYEIIRKRARSASEKQSKLNTMVKLISKKLVENSVMSDPKNSNAGTLFCAFAQYNDIKSLNQNVQIDINIGNLEWLKFSYHSESYEGNVKGLHRTQLIVSLFVNKKRIFRHGSGVFNSAIGKYEATVPKEVINLLNEIYDFNNHELTEDILNNFYKLHEFLIKNLSKEELYSIYDIYLKILDSTRTDIPSMLQDYWIKNQDRLNLSGKFLPEDSNLYKYRIV